MFVLRLSARPLAIVAVAAVLAVASPTFAQLLPAALSPDAYARLGIAYAHRPGVVGRVLRHLRERLI